MNANRQERTVTIGICRLCGRILTITDNITCQNGAVYGKIVCSICIDESTNNRIIIPTLQIIQPDLCIIVVPTVSEGVDICDSGVGRTGFDRRNTPCIVGIFGNSLSILVNDSNDVALKVLDEVVGNIIVENTTNTFFIVVDRNKRIGSPRFTQDFCTLKSIGVLYAPYCLARSDTIRIVGI